MGIILSTFPQVLQLLARFHGDGRRGAAEPPAVPEEAAGGEAQRDRPSGPAGAPTAPGPARPRSRSASAHRTARRASSRRVTAFSFYHRNAFLHNSVSQLGNLQRALAERLFWKFETRVHQRPQATGRPTATATQRAARCPAANRSQPAGSPGPEPGGGTHPPHSPPDGAALLPSTPRPVHPPQRCRLLLQLGFFALPNSSVVPPPRVTHGKGFQTESVPREGKHHHPQPSHLARRPTPSTRFLEPERFTEELHLWAIKLGTCFKKWILVQVG